MCGIYFSLSPAGLSPDAETVKLLQARGPDCYRAITRRVEITTGDEMPPPPSSNYVLTFASSVLGLRGDTIQPQPMVDEASGSVLCWNGEAWLSDDCCVNGNDAKFVFEKLTAATTSPPILSCQMIMAVLTSISGPFSIVFYHAPSSRLYYGRDRYGRRSLLETRTIESELIVSSVGMQAHRPGVEVKTDGIRLIQLQNDLANLQSRLVRWPTFQPEINRLVPSKDDLPSPNISVTLQGLEKSLFRSLQLRTADIPDLKTFNAPPGAAKIAVLFSGGIDCTVLTCLMHGIIPKEQVIDLLNVAFENPRSIAAHAINPTNAFEICPDRITGRSSFAELVKICPSRNWRFVAIDIPYNESVEHRSRIVRLMHPHDTEMDLSIAMALYFAARGQGAAEYPSAFSDDGEPRCNSLYTTTARVLISGLGADELFGGYSRHASAFSRHGYPGLLQELELDYKRIGERNLGRDDRVMSHWGREVRYPYLDENFVEYVLGLPVWEKCGFGWSEKRDERPTVDPAKALLRLLALQLGLKTAAQKEKRAIQFGAKTAKMEVGHGRRRGTDTVNEALPR